MPDVEATVLTNRKLNQEIEQLKHQNDRSFFWAWLWNNGSSLVSALALFLAGVVAVFKYFSDRDAEREKRVEERFLSAATRLGDEKEGPKISAAVLLQTFLRPGYEQFYIQIFNLAVAHLRPRGINPLISEQSSPPSQTTSIVPNKPPLQEKQDDLSIPPSPNSLNQALITVFKESFPLARKELQKTNAQFDPQMLNAADICLDNAHLLASADLASSWLVKASLRRANLMQAKLQEAHLEGAQLQGANLKGANLTRALLQKAHLEGAQLQGANLTEANLIDTQLRGANLEGAQLQGANLRRVNLERANLEGANLEEAQLVDAHLKEAQLVDAHLTDAQLQRADLEGATLERANLTRAHLEGANLERANLNAATLNGAVLPRLSKM